MLLEDALNELLALAAATTTAPAAELPRTGARTYPDGLTAREVEVLRPIAAGKGTREIAEALVIGGATVERPRPVEPLL